MNANRSVRSFRRYILVTSIIVIFVSPAIALDVQTHSAINKHIADENLLLCDFSLDKYLKDYLEIIDGVNAAFNSQTVRNWLSDGGEFEDKPPGCVPYWRSRNHFHNPIDNSGFSGWWDTGIFTGMSAVNWILQPTNSQGCGYYSWNDARQYYYAALTSTNKSERDSNFAQTFRAIGQSMHLLQDISVPEHTRNDGHYLSYDYEEWAKVLQPSKYTSRPFTPDAMFPLTIKNLFDTDQYNGTNPMSSSNIGLAEYTNANFLSPDTIFSTNFNYPSYSDMLPNIEVDASSGKRTLYLSKSGPGETISHFARAGNFYNYLPPDYKKLALTVSDEKIYKDYSDLLIPRAIGYSSQVLSYFFRGKIDLIPNPENSSGYVISNDTAEEMDGPFSLYYDDTNDARKPIPLGNFLIGANDKSSNIVFSVPVDAKEPGKYMLVFQGRLGNESGAVVGKAVVLANKEYAAITVTVNGATATKSLSIIWNMATDAMADDVVKNAGGTAIFPIDPSEISNWVAARENAGKGALYSQSLCGIAPWDYGFMGCSCSWGEPKLLEELYNEPSGCISGVSDYQEYSCECVPSTYQIKDNPSPQQAMTSIKLLQHDIKGIKGSKKYIAKNNSGIQTAYRAASILNRTVIVYGAEGGGCSTPAEGNSQSYADTVTRKYLSPIGEIMSIALESNGNADYCTNTGHTDEVTLDTVRDYKLAEDAIYSDHTFLQVWAIDSILVSHRMECGDCGTGAGIYAGPGCIDPFHPGPWLEEIRDRKGLHVALQAKYLPAGTDGVDPTAFPRNPSLENHVSMMYTALRNTLGIAEHSVTNFSIGLNIYK